MDAPEQKVRHPLFARLYAKASPRGEDRGQAEHRRKLLAGLSGRVVEVGAGNGLNFPHYPSEVSEVVAVEPEPYLCDCAREAATEAPVAVEVIAGIADDLPADDASFDAGVASLVLCSVPDQGRALAELFRVIRPGGELRFYEHVVSDRPAFARLERVLSTVVWSRISGGCHLDRDTTSAIERAGFEIERYERFPFTPFPLSPDIAHILGVARRPGDADAEAEARTPSGR
jgi:ubiquinone/menaquinone biosynthesis C-methylase UbiE